jgi:ABC-type multidrug transport system fused ATPase/permease subunit
LIGYLPIFGLILGTFGIMVKNITEAKFDIVKQMGGVVSETLYAIKVVSSFGMEEKEIEKFKIWNKKTEIMGKKFVDRFSFMYGIMKFAIFSFYTFAFYIGSQMIYEGTPNSNSDDQPYTPQEVITILIALITGYISLIASLPSIQAVVAAKQVGGEIFAVIDRVPKIRDGVEAVDHFTLKKEIEFINVTFKYPTAPKE